MNLYFVISKTIFFYCFIVIVYRIMGKREIGQLGVIDLIVSILIAELVAISIENSDQNIVYTVIPIFVLMSLEMSVAYLSIKCMWVRKMIDGNVSLIVYNGKLNYRELIKQRYSLDDFLLSLRQKSIKSIDEVEFAFLEKNGKLSIFTFDDSEKGVYPMPLIVDGDVNLDVLEKIKKSKKWLNNELILKKLTVDDVFYAFYKNKKLFIIKKS